MGIVNVTTDSFADGGQFLAAPRAIAHGLKLRDEGADFVDVGGESTRPGAEPVPLDEELRRVIPVVEALAREGVAVSVDTLKPEVMCAAIDAGCAVVNDVNAFRAAGAIEAVAKSRVGVVVMHMQGTPATMQKAPHYEDVVAEVGAFLRLRARALEDAGVARERIALDPGFGFGKNLEHNLALLHDIAAFCDLRVPVLVGPSRKRFIGELSGVQDPAERIEGTAGAVAWCAAQGIDVLRVHDVMQMTRVVRVVDAIVRGAR